MSRNDFYDDDLVDQYDDLDDEDGELSPEDRKAMEEGTLRVQKALGSNAIKISVTQIHEALWHYYYDVDKSVAYLRKSLISSATKPMPKPASKKPQDGKCEKFIFSNNLCLFATPAGAGHEVVAAAKASSSASSNFSGSRHTFWRPRLSPASDAFSDMPWLKVPQDRQAIFVPPPKPRGGLLGGCEGPPKMSKLQALAAARKKQSDARKEQERFSQAENSFKRLSLSENLYVEGTGPSANPAKRQKNSEKLLQRHPIRDSISESSRCVYVSQETEPAGKGGKEEAMVKSDAFNASTEARQVTTTASIAEPSAFARVLIGSGPDPRQANKPNVFPMPYESSPYFRASAFEEPSPDDIVLTVQAKAGKKITATPKLTKMTDAEDVKKLAGISSSVSGLKIDNDSCPPNRKGLDVIKEFENSNAKKSTSFVVVGHVDAGKSTLMGRLLVELDYVEQRTVDKYRRQAEKSGKQSFALAWVMDQGSEERDRGVTIDIATSYFETPTTNFTILDAPGHRDFVPNMIAGASQADMAILVIDANTGAFERGLKGQTREHVLLLRSLGVQRLIVAVNKLDMVGWSKERFDEITEQVEGFLAGLGFQSRCLSFVPISGLNGDNITRKIESAAARWYAGPTLMEALETTGPTTTRALSRAFRMPISEVFRSQQGTTTLAGRIDAGTVQVGDSVVVQPSGESAYIKSIVVDGDARDWAVAGQNATIALTNIDPVHIRVGDIVCDAKEAISCEDTYTMKAMAFDHLMPMPVDVHRGRLYVPGQIRSISAVLDKATGEVVKKKPKIVQPGAVARIVIGLDSKVPLEAGHRLVIRSGGETIAAGLVE